MRDNQYDVLVIGAGVSGIGMACQLRMKCPGKRVAVLERRNAVGGTWDLFRYPGVRSDSDLTDVRIQLPALDRDGCLR